MAAAPSTTALAFAAVMIPPASNAGHSFAIFARLISSKMCVSYFTVTGSRAPSVCSVTGSISSSNQPAFRAAFALLCERKPMSSASSRVMP